MEVTLCLSTIKNLKYRKLNLMVAVLHSYLKYIMDNLLILFFKGLSDDFLYKWPYLIFTKFILYINLN